MSTGTLDRMSVRYFQTALANGVTVEDGANGSKIIKDMPIFRSGTFKDSMGDQHTWEMEHLQQMVFHFGLLRDRNILRDVPVRNGHKSLFGSGGEVVGYFADLRVGPTTDRGDTLLVADLEITEPDAFGKIERGTLRARSAEIGYYETNDEAMFWPVVMGVAFVDIPAVEGLFSNHQTSEDKFTPVRDSNEEVPPVGQKQTEQNKGGTTPPAEGQGGTATATTTQEGGSGTQEQQQEGQEGQGGEGNRAEGAGTVEQPAQHGNAATAPPAQPAPVTQGNVHSFSLHGQPTTDFAAVQRHIDNLESVLAENRDQARRDFVKDLAEKGKISAPQVDEMQNHAISLTDEQYASFAKMWEAAPEAGLFAQHTEGGTDTAAGEATEIETLRERVAMHKRAGTPEEKIKETESYKRLMSLTENKG